VARYLRALHAHITPVMQLLSAPALPPAANL